MIDINLILNENEEISFDVKAELEFPSKYRPKTTKGYKTKYDSNALKKILQ